MFALAIVVLLGLGASLAARRRILVLRRTPLARILTPFRSPTSRQIIPPVAKLPAREKYRLPFVLNFKHVCFGSLADIQKRQSHVRFTPESRHAERRHRCPLSANSGPSV